MITSFKIYESTGLKYLHKFFLFEEEDKVYVIYFYKIKKVGTKFKINWISFTDYDDELTSYRLSFTKKLSEIRETILNKLVTAKELYKKYPEFTVRIYNYTDNESLKNQLEKIEEIRFIRDTEKFGI